MNEFGQQLTQIGIDCSRRLNTMWTKAIKFNSSYRRPVVDGYLQVDLSVLLFKPYIIDVANVRYRNKER